MLWKNNFAPDKSPKKRNPEVNPIMIDRAAGSMKFG
jgi:hypothetical protein